MAIHRKKKSLLPTILLLTVVLLLVLVGFMGFTVWQDSQQVFQDLTLELGTTQLRIEDFLTPVGNPSRASFVTDPSTIDLNKVGRTSLTLKHGTRTAVVNLIIQDTTPPVAGFPTEYTVDVSDSLPQAGALVSNIVDQSQVRVYYAETPEIPEDYGDRDVTIVVEDTSGNATRGQCLFHFSGWLKETCTLELGQAPTPEQLLVFPEKDAALLENLDLESLNSPGEHTLTVKAGTSAAQCVVTVQDTTAPTLEVKNLQSLPGVPVQPQDFVVSAEDPSGEPEISISGELPDLSKSGTYTVTIEATDSSGNVAKKEATLWISEDRNPPVIHGVSKDLTVERNSSPDLMDGVYADDEESGQCDVTVDSSALDLSKEGTYVITYFTMDNAGNIRYRQRNIIVK